MVPQLARVSNNNHHSPPAAADHHDSRHHHSPASTPPASDLIWPFGKLEGLDRDDFREAAYEIFFTACRSSPGFGGRSAISYYSNSTPNSEERDGSGSGSAPGSPVKKPHGVGMAVTSRVKRTLGLKMLRRSQSRRASSCGTTPLSPNSSGTGSLSPRSMAFSTVPSPRTRRPMTSAEIMRQQMRVTEQSDNRLRKTLMRTLVGQMGRRAETIILPLELLRHLKPSEFNDPQEYHLWQKRQFTILETGLLLHPAIPLEKSNEFAARLRDIIQASETKAIDTSKNSESMRSLCNCIVSLAWRSVDGSPTDVCHWADGYPLNVHIYMALLYSVFDLKEETAVLDEVDELLELMKKTWSTLGINRSIHNLCFTWVLFEQYITTGQVEGDLLGASLTMLAEVANDAKKVDREPLYVKMLASSLNSMKRWAEKRLLDYHRNFDMGTIGQMENIVPLLFSTMKILEEDVPGYIGKMESIVPSVFSSMKISPEDVPGYVAAAKEKGEFVDDSSGNRVDLYIRSSLRNAFAQMLKDGNMDGAVVEMEEASEVLIKLANEVEILALKEKDIFSPILKKWHPMAAGIGAVTLHTCYGTLLKQYIEAAPILTDESITLLQRAGKLEKALVQMVVEDTVDCEDGGKAIVREMLPYEVDSIIVNRMRQWIQEMEKKGKELIQRAKETDSWNPKSKHEPYAHSAVELLKHVKESTDKFLEIPVNITEDLVHDLADGLERLFRDYITYVASCGSKQSYIPTLPPLTRCSSNSKFSKLWKRAACSVGIDDPSHVINEGNNPRPSTSHGTQRLYIRLNTLHYIYSQLHSLEKTISLSPKVVPSQRSRFNNRNRQIGSSSSLFEQTRSSVQVATQHVSEVAAYRLIFLDSGSVFIGSLYVGDVVNARNFPALRILKQNLTLLCAIVNERAQPLALKEVMKASFEAFLLVLLAGGSSRTFLRSDHPMIEEDFDSLKKMFCTCGEGLMVEESVNKEAEIVEGVIELMGQSTEQLIEDFSIVACEASGIGVLGSNQKLPMPPTTGKWNRSDPNTILRVLCYRNDHMANQFLKRTFQLPKRCY